MIDSTQATDQTEQEEAPVADEPTKKKKKKKGKKNQDVENPYPDALEDEMKEGGSDEGNNDSDDADEWEQQPEEYA